MAIADINFVGAETGDISEAAASSGTVTAQASVKKNGAYAYYMDPAGGTGSLSFGNGVDGAHAAIGRTAETFYCFWFRCSDATDTADICYIAETSAGGNRIMTIGKDGSGNVLANTVDTGLDVADNTWHLFQIRATSNGTCGIKIDGGSEYTFTGGNFTQNYILLRGDATASRDTYFDDIAIGTTEAPGVKVSAASVPIGAGNHADWTGGTPYQQVDELPHDGTTTQISSGTGAGTPRSTFDMQSCATIGVDSDAIYAVKVVGILRESTATSTLGGVTLREGGSNFDSTAVDVGGTTYAAFSSIDALAPSDSSAWTRAKVDAAEAGVYRSSSDTSQIQATAVYLIVCYAINVQYEVSVSGSAGAFSGALTRRTNKPLAGTAGSLSGTLARRANKALAGAWAAPTGAVARAKTTAVALAGAAGAFTGALSRSTLKGLAGAAGAFTGAANRHTAMSVAGTAGDFAGTLAQIRTYVVDLAGAAGAMAGSLIGRANKALSGAAGDASGTLSRSTNKALAGAAGDASGALTSTKVSFVSLAGAAGSFTGVIVRSARKSLAGAWDSPAGTLSRLIIYGVTMAGSWGAPSGSLSRATSKTFSGAWAAPSGALAQIRTYIVSVAGTAGAVAGTLSRRTNKPLAGVMGATFGDISRQPRKALSGAWAAPSGAIAYFRGKPVSGTAGAFTGSLARSTRKLLGGELSPVGQANKLLRVALAGTAGSFTGTVVANVFALLSGRLRPPAGLGTMARRMGAGLSNFLQRPPTGDSGSERRPPPGGG